MSNQETISFTLRGMSQDLEKNLSAIAMMEGKSRNQLILDTLTKEFSNPIATYARKSPLVKAMDVDLCNKMGCGLNKEWYDNPYIINSDKKYCRLLNLNSESDVDDIFKRNFALIEFRARQLLDKGYKKFPLGISLTFALFVQIAREDKDKIKEIKEIIFHLTDDFYNSINEIRVKLGLPIIEE